jgi:uncharacterized protein with PIN domain
MADLERREQPAHVRTHLFGGRTAGHRPLCRRRLSQASGFLDCVGIDVVPVNQALVETTYAGWLRYGKSRHPTGLNYGDSGFRHPARNDVGASPSARLPRSR